MCVEGFDESPQETYEDEDAERMSIMIQTMALPPFSSRVHFSYLSRISY